MNALMLHQLACCVLGIVAGAFCRSYLEAKFAGFAVGFLYAVALIVFLPMAKYVLLTSGIIGVLFAMLGHFIRLKVVRAKS